MPQWKGKTRGGKFGYLFFIYLIRYLGVGAAYTFLYFVVAYFLLFARKASSAIKDFARKGLGYNRLEAWKLSCRNFYSLGQILIDKMAILNGMNDRYEFEFENYEPFLNVLNADCGVVMIGAHVGNWECGAPFFGSYGKKINVVMFDAEYRSIKEVLEENKNIESDYKVIPVNADSLSHVFLINDAIQKNEYVCFQGDRYVNEDKLLYADFLGHRAAFPAGPFLLATRMKTPIVFYYAMREKGRKYSFHFEVIEPIKRSKEVKAEEVLLNRYVESLERIVKRYPEQWFNYYKFWECDK